MSQSFDLETPDHFTTGAVGPAGQRVFYLQAREGRVLVTLKAEKEQVNALGEYLAGLLNRLTESRESTPEDLGLLEPIDPAWAVGSIGVGYEQDRGRIVIVANERVEEEDEEEDAEGERGERGEREEEERTAASGEEPASARFHVTRAQAAGFVERARALMKAGRPICPMCSQPKDPSGHVCPRSNGHVVR
jgi:uncharacterized repeat protein (TIGR03847 family)